MMKHLIWSLIICLGLWSCSQDSNKEEASLGKESDTEEKTSIAQPASNNETKPAVNMEDVTAEGEKAEGQDSQMAAFAFSEDTYDFGTIREGEIVTHTFKFTNSGKVPLVIEDARASCGCTVPEWPKEPIPPGASNEIKVEFNSSNKAGNVNKSVSITANTKPAVTTVFIKGEVKAVSKMNGPVRR